jgi:hypothetical protein
MIHYMRTDTICTINSNTIRFIKSNTVRSSCSRWQEIRNLQKVLVGTPEGRGHFGDGGRRCDDNIKMYPKELGFRV